MKHARLFLVLFVAICSSGLAVSTADATIVFGRGSLGPSDSKVTCTFNAGLNGVTLTISANPTVLAANVRAGNGNDWQYVNYAFSVRYLDQYVVTTPFAGWLLVNDNTPLFWNAPVSTNHFVNTLYNASDGEGYSVYLYTYWIDAWTGQFVGDRWDRIDGPGSYINIRTGFSTGYSDKSCLYPRGFGE